MQAWEVPWLPQVVEAVQARDRLPATHSGAPRPTTGIEAPPASTVQLRDPLDVRWDAVLMTIYLAGVLLVLCGPLAGVIRLCRIRRNVEVLSDGRRWRSLIDEFSGHRGTRRRVVVACSPAVPVPMTWGVFRGSVSIRFSTKPSGGLA